MSKINAYQNGGWWEELGRAILTVAGDTISITPIVAKKYLAIEIKTIATGGTTNHNVRFNNDSAANYAIRYSINGTADVATGSTTSLLAHASTSAEHKFAVCWVDNLTSTEKLFTGHGLNSSAAGAANVGGRVEFSGKWANTAAQITRVDVINAGTGDFAIGSEVIVMGHD